VAPFVVLVVVTLLARAAGAVGAAHLADRTAALAAGLAAMFVLTGVAHFTPRRRAGLVAIVPPAVPRPALAVTVTGALELAGAVGLLVPASRSLAAVCLAVLLVALYPANVHAAAARRAPDAPHTPLGRRTALQLAYLAAAVAVALGA
jgi:uncharacterized membrane protein